MDQGYVKLWRKSIKSRTFQNADLWKVWSWCLMKANYEEAWVPVSTGRGETEVHLLPGQFIFGRKTAAKELKMNESSTRNRMEKLRDIENLTLKTDTHYSIITIINWPIYQNKEIKEDRQEDNQRTTKGQPKDTNKNDKNEKNTIYLRTFSLFWKNYPRKEAKKKAWQAWFKVADPEAVIEKMKVILPIQMESEQWTKENGKYIPMPTTYINQERWEDEIHE